MTDIEENLMSYIQKECLPKNNDIAPGLEEDLFDAGIVDSAGLISFIAYIELEYNLSIPDEDLLPENFRSISAITKYLSSKMNSS